MNKHDQAHRRAQRRVRREARRAEALDARIERGLYPGPVGPRPTDPRLHEYQDRAVSHLWERPRAALFLEMGLGKTATVLQALTPDHLPAIVIGPKRVAERVWPAEGPKWRPDLVVQAAKGTPKQRQAVLDSGADVTSISRENAVGLDLGRWRTVVIDELSGYKNPSSKRTKDLVKQTENSPYVWGLTGTPAPQGYLDLWPQIYLLDRGYRLGRTMTQYRERYFDAGRRMPNGAIIEWNLKPGAREEIESRISDLTLAMRTEDYLDLPDTIHNRVEVDLPRASWVAYEQTKTSLVAEVGGVKYTSDSKGVALGRLAQICAGCLYPDVEDQARGAQPVQLHRQKIDAVAEIVEGAGSPVLVLYQYQWERDQLLQSIPGSKHISDPSSQDDWDAGRVTALVSHPASVGHGLNLQHGGHVMVWSSLPWSLEEYDQTVARLARQGQDRPVLVHYVVVPGTIDDVILGALQEKSDVMGRLMRVLSGVDAPT